MKKHEHTTNTQNDIQKGKEKDDMTKYFELSFRSNYNTYNYQNKKIILYDDHRCILNVLFFAKTKGLLIEAPNIIYYDKHDDCIKPRKEQLKKIKTFTKSNPSFENFMKFVEFKIRHSDDDWLTTGMEMGLINHAINIGGSVIHNIESLANNVYTDHKNNKHEIYSISHLDFELGERGCIGDLYEKEPYYKRVREIMQFNLKNDFKFSAESIYPLILDFDLDCFTGEIAGRTIAWPEEIFQEKMVNNERYDRASPFYVLNQLIERCEVITICREPNSCGGIGESNKILNYLDKYLFHNYIRTSPCV